MTLIEVGDNEQARDVLVEAVNARRVELAGLLGAVADALGDSELTEASYRKVIEAGDPDALSDFAVFLRGEERYVRAQPDPQLRDRWWLPARPSLALRLAIAGMSTD